MNKILYMKLAKLFVIYFMPILVSAQVLCDIFYLTDKPLYEWMSFYINTIFGVNLMVAVFFCIFTFSFRFCSISKYCALVELLYVFILLVFKEDNVYNIVFQIISGTFALGITIYTIKKRYPLCTISQGLALVGNYFRTISNKKWFGDCNVAIKMFDLETKEKFRKQKRNGYIS